MGVDYEGLVDFLARTEGPFGVLTMQATPTAGRLMAHFPDRLAALYSAEHGYFGIALPGEKTASTRHPIWDKPIHSLYGEHRKPTPEMLQGIGRMVIDLCDIGVRCYTYLATLKNTLEACAEAGLPVTVLDRPVPFGGVVDGPMLEPSLASFVAPVEVPLCHGMTPGECATWIAGRESLKLELNVIRVRDWSHADRSPWPNFIPPSPAIRSWDSAALYPLTVFTEAYPAVDCDRSGSLAFRVIGAPWLEATAVVGDVGRELAACGVEARPYRYVTQYGAYKETALDGVLFSIAGGCGAFRPAEAGVRVLTALVRRYGDKVFAEGRDAWLDKLYGTTSVREAVKGGDIEPLFGVWADGLAAYRQTRADFYSQGRPR